MMMVGGSSLHLNWIGTIALNQALGSRHLIVVENSSFGPRAFGSAPVNPPPTFKAV